MKGVCREIVTDTLICGIFGVKETIFAWGMVMTLIFGSLRLWRDSKVIRW